jgi:hypothetical protein
MLTLSLFFVFLLSVVDSDSRLVHEWSFDNVDPLLDAATGAVRGALLGSAAVEGGLLRIRAPEDQFVVVGDARVPSDALGTTLMAWMALVDPFGNVSTAGLSAGASLWRLSSLDSAASDALGLMRLSGRTILYAASATRERSLLQLSDEPLSAAAPHLTHVAAVFDHFESTVALYVDGQLYKPVYGVEPTQTARFSAGAVLTIGGGERDGAALPLAFDVARVRFYDTALTAGEVQVAFLVRRCSNGRLDDGERGVDCGAPCGECSDRCANLVRDGDETDVDCGGLDCAKCAPVRDEQRAVLHQHAPTDVRYPAPKLTLGGNGGLSARVTASLIRARAEMVNVRVLAASGSSQSDSGGSCGGMQSAQRLLGDRGWLGNDAHFHTATNSDLCLHSWCDSNARASIAFDLGAVLHIDEMRVWNWNVANASELGARLIDVELSNDSDAGFRPHRSRLLLQQAPGFDAAAFVQRVPFAKAVARYVRLGNMIDWRNRAGGALSKLRFIGRPVEHVHAAPMNLGAPGGFVARGDGSVGVSDGVWQRPFMAGDTVQLLFSQPATVTGVVAACVERAGGETARGPFATLSCDAGKVTSDLVLTDSHLFGLRNVSECMLTASGDATFALAEIRWRAEH